MGAMKACLFCVRIHEDALDGVCVQDAKIIERPPNGLDGSNDAGLDGKVIVTRPICAPVASTAM
jgi:hypothetical protein